MGVGWAGRVVSGPACFFAFQRGQCTMTRVAQSLDQRPSSGSAFRRQHAPRPRGRRFTLVELLVAMGLLSVMMLLLVQFLLMAQRRWAANSANTRMFENSRLVFELLEHDLRAAIASGVPSHQIGFHVGNPVTTDAGNCLYLCVVSSTDPHQDAKCHLSEISYRFHLDQATATPLTPPFVLARQVVSDNDAANWDFPGRPANWWQNDHASADLAEYEPVISGVASFTVLCYDRDERLIVPGTDLLELPNRVEISLELFDEAYRNAPVDVRFQHTRAFTRVLYLGDMRTN